MGLDFYTVHSSSVDNLPPLGDSGLSFSSHLPSRYWHPLLDSLHKSGEHSLLLQVVESMRGVHVTPDKHCHMRAIQSSLATHQYVQAIRIAEDMLMRSASSSSIRSSDNDSGGDLDLDETTAPDLDIYKPILLYLAGNDLPTEVIQVVKQMDAAGVSIDSDTWTCVEKMRRFDIVLEFFERKS